MRSSRKAYWVGLIVFGLVGAYFSGISTYDFVAHLDRQVHSVSCSFIPGGRLDTTGTSGCYAVMMSPYSSVFRDWTWGGIPIALPSLSVFAYLVFFAFDLLQRKAQHKPKETVFAVLATALPLAMSIIYAYVSVKLVGSMCKSCIGIYVASAGAFAVSLIGYFVSRRDQDPEAADPIPWGRYALAFGEGVAFVAVPLALFLAFKPAYTDALARCGSLIQPGDKYGVQMRLNHPVEGAAPAVVLIDPLCPACKAFHERLKQSAWEDKLDLRGVVFPLDKECNWMVTQSLHPGACAVSELLLCAGDRAPEALAWAFENQQRLRETAARDMGALHREIAARYPELGDCLQKPAAKSRINKSLRWIVSNAAEVMVPQLFIDGQKLCSEDSDLGLEFAIGRALSRQGGGKR